MGTLFSSLNIARSGLLTAQLQLDTTAHNVANVNTEGYSRQRVELLSRRPITRQFGQIGRGVQVTNIERIRDEFLDLAYREQASGLGNVDIQADYYRLIDGVFLEPGDNGFGTRLGAFFDTLSDFANNVEEFPVREALVSEARQLALSLNQVAGRFYDLRSNANEEIRNMVPEINSITGRIGELNRLIHRAEGNETTANDLRDERDRLLDELSLLVDINYNEDEFGLVSVRVGSEALVEGTLVNEVEAVRDAALDPVRQDLVEIRFVSNGRALPPTEGELAGLIEMRDTVLPLFDDRIDTLATTLIQELNAIHSQGNGLTNLTGTISSTNDVSAATDPLTAAGLPFPVTPGTFDVVVYDAAGTPTTTTVTITAATTLNDLATSLNGIANFNASVSGDQIDLSAAAGFSFSFANDNAGVLPALGINGFFTGSDARSIAVNPDVAADLNTLTSGYSLDILDTGDNTAALAMADLRNTLVLDGNSSTLNDYYETTIARLGTDSRSNNETLAVQQTFVSDFSRRRQEVSGVSIDEEVTLLVQFQRAYEASARIVTVTDQMLQTLIGMAR